MRLICVVIAGMGLAGCGGGGGASGPAGHALSSADQGKVEKAAAVANGIQASPDNPDQVLQLNGLTEKQYEDLLYEIAADPAMSEAYNAKLKR